MNDVIYFEVDTAVGGFVWRIRRHGNHEILCGSEILQSRAACYYAINLVRDNAHNAGVWDRPNQTWINV